ncbi:hypothetical protein IID22_04160, partial [Patescibacteria group bacterium]|nr:hypothetical protein [Patescibacteria group bacterium]
MQDPQDNTIEEEIALIKNKATMIRVFMVWSPPDPTTILNVECVLIVDGSVNRQRADIYYQGGNTYILPRGTTFNGSPAANQARDAFNFIFPDTNGHHPSSAIMETSARLRIDGVSIAFNFEDFELQNFTDQSSNGDSRMTFSFRTVESLKKPIRSNRRQLVNFARKQFDRMVAVYPVPHTQASYSLTTQPLQLAGGLGSFSLWLLTMSLDRPGLQNIDRFVYITSGETPRTRTTPAQDSLLEDF